ncbi:YIP1 family protein [Bacillus sp. A116_S68]|nr:YIP1 family protein [Bacillus sp. A116_S68]
MLKSTDIIINPLRFMERLENKPNVVIPLLVAIASSLIVFYGGINEIQQYLSGQDPIILVTISIFNVFSLIITTLIIYLLLNLLPLKKKFSYRQLFSVYGFSQIPKLLQATLLAIFPTYINLYINNASFFEHLLAFYINPFSIWRYVLLIAACIVLTKLKFKTVVITFITFSVIEMLFTYFSNNLSL